jgi:hypothetical protein
MILLAPLIDSRLRVNRAKAGRRERVIKERLLVER